MAPAVGQSTRNGLPLPCSPLPSAHTPLAPASPLPRAPPVDRDGRAQAPARARIGTALGPQHGRSRADSPEHLATAVTTHTLWFHRPFRIDDWLLVAQESPCAAGARGFGLGHVFSGESAKHATLVASFAQESLIRKR